MNNQGKLNVVYDKVTGEVVLTEQEGTWVIPSRWDVNSFDADEDPFAEDSKGNLFLKSTAMYPREAPS